MLQCNFMSIKMISYNGRRGSARDSTLEMTLQKKYCQKKLDECCQKKKLDEEK